MRKWKTMVLTLMTAAICASLILPAGAAERFARRLEAVYRDIKIIVDGVETTPTDVNGNVVEPFIVDGTTYVPLRAVAQMFQKEVEWDDESNAVILRSLSAQTEKPQPVDAPPAPSKNVTVSTAQELADAIAPDTRITLKAGVYDMSTVTKTDNKYVQVENGAAALLVMDIEGLTLEAAAGAKVEITTPNRFSEVLLFSGCNGVTLSGITAGHSVTGEYQCDAGVVLFDQSSNIKVEDSLLYGCGSVGISLKSCVSALITGTVVTDCSLRAVNIWGSADITFEKCKFIDNRAYGGIIMGYNSSAVFRSSEISGNKSLEWSAIEFDGDVLFDGCVFRNNALVNGVEPVFKGQGIRISDCEIEKGNFGGYWTGSGITDLGGNTQS